jgi:hypothetical protein
MVYLFKTLVNLIIISIQVDLGSELNIVEVDYFGRHSHYNFKLIVLAYLDCLHKHY